MSSHIKPFAQDLLAIYEEGLLDDVAEELFCESNGGLESSYELADEAIQRQLESEKES